MSEEPLWLGCVRWLCDLKVLPDDHLLTSANASVQELAYSLRDGVLLCQVVNALAPGTIPHQQINFRTCNSQFLCLKNIWLFLNSCSKTFKIQSRHLFQPSMLYDFTDFRKVLKTLSYLSRCVKVEGVTPFPDKSKHPPQQDVYVHQQLKEEGIYRRLEYSVQENFYKINYGDHRQLGSSDDRSSQIYQTYLGANFRSRSSLQLSKDIVPKEKRDHIIIELVVTEAKYVDVLNLIYNNFMRCLTSLKLNERKTVFQDIPLLLEIHTALSALLFDAVNKHNVKKIGQIFVQFKAKFLTYGEYCNNLPTAQDTLTTLCDTNDKVGRQVAECELKTDGGNFKLRDYLAVPMQRILKYHLIFRELLHNTPADHEEYSVLKPALDSMIEVAQYINEVKRDAESTQLLQQIQQNIDKLNLPMGNVLKKYGHLRRDGPLRIAVSGSETGPPPDASSSKPRVRYVFLLDQVALICKPTKGDRYIFKESIMIKDYVVNDSSKEKPDTPWYPNLSTLVKLLAFSKWTYGFSLVHVDQKKQFSVTARTEEDKCLWVKAFEEVQQNVNPDVSCTSHKLQMATFTVPDITCDLCQKLLMGLYYQGYSCDICGCKVHKECISKLNKCSSTPKPPRLPPRNVSIPARLSSSSFKGELSRANSCRVGRWTRQLDDRRSCVSLGNLDRADLRLKKYPWFVGSISRKEVERKLGPFPCGSYLVRERLDAEPKERYALSLKTKSGVKHMIIKSEPLRQPVDDHEDEVASLPLIPRSRSSSSAMMYFLGTDKFHSIPELVHWYSKNSLKDCFSHLDQTLQFPVGQISFVRSMYPFDPDPKKEPSVLRMKKGQTFIVIDKAGDEDGWWKAMRCRDNKVGFIPKAYVVSIKDPPLSTDSGYYDSSF